MRHVYTEFGVVEVLVVGEGALYEVGEHRVGEHLLPLEVAERLGVSLLLQRLGILVDEGIVDLLGVVFGVDPASGERAHAQPGGKDE